ncbi:MAG: ATP-binding protein [Caldilineaceae bacterium]|nr:ATP-binding protein [Caldilineaceae bacterium]
MDGFKNLVNFAVDFGPFTCIAGPNSVGKSNVFDAIRFLSLLTDHTIMEAALQVRGSGIDASDIRGLFHSSEHGYADRFRIAAEMIVEPHVRDDFGRPAEATSTFLRYEVEIGYESPTFRGILGRLVLLSETLNYITEGDANNKLKFPHSAQNFRKAVVVNKRRSASGYISVQTAADGQTEIVVHQDGGSRGPGQIAPAATAPRTIVGTSNTSVTPTILAARREMQKWQFLALEPSAMRKPDHFQAESYLSANGAHLPATLYRLVTSEANGEEESAGIYATIANRLSELVPIDEVNVEVDEVRQLLTLEVTERTGVRLPASSLSDGTLRFLTLAVLVADPEAQGVICIEEPENGIHPAKMNEMVKLLQDLAVDPSEVPGPENPFRQVVVATHSPAFVQLQDRQDLLFALETRMKGKHGQSIQTLRCQPLEKTWRAEAGQSSVGLGTILAYLSAPPGAQLELSQLVYE